jgi:hypothetical protein
LNDVGGSGSGSPPHKSSRIPVRETVGGSTTTKQSAKLYDWQSADFGLTSN